MYNLTQDGFLRQQFTIGIDYDDDIEMAREKIIELVNSKEDVLNRFIKAASQFNADHVVRICADNPFICYNLIDDLIDQLEDL